MVRAELLQYNITYDRNEKDVRFIAKQIETHLRERFNVLVSVIEYQIVNGHLVRLGRKEPFVESIRRGRDVIQKLSPNTIDIDRENAEVTGFEKIDSFLSNPTTPLNSKMLSVSPNGEEGSKYQHNFYDIFTLKENNGERYVELLRYSSALSRRDYARHLGLDSNDPPQAADFLGNPIKVSILMSPEQIHKALHMDHEYMNLSDFDEIWASSMIKFYLERYKLNRDARSFNAILNAADEVLENKNRKDKGQIYRDYSIYNPSYSQTRYLEEKKVRQAGGQCPGKSGADIDASPYSVSDFASLEQDKYGERTFECPSCGKINIRPKDELIKECQHCGSKDVAC